MNLQTLESLLMDQVSGELSADCGQLLTAYLQDHPEYESLGKSIRETAETLRQVVAGGKCESLPSFSADRFRLDERHYKRRNQGRWWLLIAACLVIGFSIGFFMNIDGGSSEATGPFADLAKISAQAKVHSSGLESARAFWSAQTYMEQFQKSRSERTDDRQDSAIQNRIAEFRKGGIL